MKKILIILILLFPTSVLALSLDCPNIASSNEEVICTLKENEINGLRAKLELEGGLTYKKIVPTSPWTSYYQSHLGFTLGNIKENTPLDAKLYLKVNNQAEIGKEYSITLKEVEESNLELKNTSLDSISSKIKIISDNNNLSTLTIKNETITPKFQENITTYYVNTENNQVEIEAIPKDPSAKVEGDIGTHSLDYGVNKFLIKVTSPRGHAKEYTIYITRKIKNISKNNDATLKKLIINHHQITLEKNKYYYDLTLENKEESLNIEAIPNNSKAKAEIEKKDKLEVGNNEIKIIVTAEDGTKSTYLIHVTRKKKLSNDSTLKSIIIKNYVLSFSPKKYKYQLEIQEENKLDIQVISNNDLAKYKIIGNENLKNNSQIKIIVTAEDKTTTTYQINIKKEQEELTSKLLNADSKILPIITFIILISMILIIKIIKTHVNKEKNR